MDDRKQLRSPLYLVYHHGRRAGGARQDVAEPLRSCHQASVKPWFQEVEVERVGQLSLEPCGFASAPGTEQEEALPWNREKSSYKFHFESNSGSDNAIMY